MFSYTNSFHVTQSQNSGGLGGGVVQNGLGVLQNVEIFNLFPGQIFLFLGTLRKGRDCSAKETTKKGKSRGEDKRRHRKKRSPLPLRHETCTRSPRTCTQICGQILDEEVERFHGREGKAQPKTCAVIFGGCADIGQKKTPKKNEVCKKAAVVREG